MKINKKHAVLAMILLYTIGVMYLTLTPSHSTIVYGTEYNTVLFKSINNYLRHMRNFGLINFEAFKYFPGNPMSFVKNIFTVSFMNLLGNVVLFMPLGVFMGMYFKRWIIIKSFLVGFLVSSAIEVIQFIGLSSRRADVDDILLNVAGALAGTILYLLYKLLTGKRETIEE